MERQESMENKMLVSFQKDQDQANFHVTLTLEPENFDALGSECRLTYDEFCDAINTEISAEESEWHELRMKDMVNLTRDAVLEATILKYAKEKYDLNSGDFTGKAIDYSKRYDTEGKFLGEAMSISYVYIPVMGVNITS